MESLTIGPLTRKTGYTFWHMAFHDFPPGPRLKRLNDVTIIYRYPNASAFVMRSWDYFDTFLSRMDIFPRSMRVDIKMDVTSTRPLTYGLGCRLLSLKRCRVVTCNGYRKCGSLWVVSPSLPSYRSTLGLH